MTTILIFIIIITLFIFLISNAKTNNKNNNKQGDLKRSSYDGAIPIDIKLDRCDYICNDPSKYKFHLMIYHYISKDQVKQISLQQIANSFNCHSSDAKEVFFKKLRTFKLEFVIKKRDERVYEMHKHLQSRNLTIKPEDTPAAFMEEWINEYIENKEYQYRKRTKLEVIEDIVALYPEYGKIIILGNKELEEKYLDDNPFVLDLIMDELAYSDEPAERCRLKAIKVRWNDDDFKEAFRIIDLGLEFNDPYTEPFLYSLKVDCFEKLSNYTLALENMNKAIESIQKNLPDNFYQICCFYKTRSEIKDKLNDIIGAMQDKEKAEIFDSKYEANKTADENYNDLPF
ncbi:hypothetical protein [Flavobacterium nackdongense]|uniref:Uncharacterized protein n=1 Tax=Flavobacterium nackdongense TaxID=2547394 RepID=A0A4V1AGZ4_9FLAO|nr:hypothetical protein [Flavobacterium nackdongense]QBN19752.1 hypothetical protein E1750_13380 [Flavobacterium nackdongense]